MNIKEEKIKLRKLFKDKRMSISSDEVIKKSFSINQNFLQNVLTEIDMQEEKQIFSCYLPINNEVLTSDIIKYFEEKNISYSLPKITNINHPLQFILSKKNQQLQQNKNYSKIQEPIDGDNIIPDIMIMPLLAFDSNLSRLGMGGGFFDRTIDHIKNHLKKKIITIGLAYDCQKYDMVLPVENTDFSLDFIVTENNVYFSYPKIYKPIFV